MLSSLTEKYRHKIKTPEELRKAVGARPRKKKVIMCHGVFDVVHPGHLRHLLYAKSKADILVTSITADHHISKGRDRPHVPQELRALNLAAFEIVDYVVIDKNATPLENLSLIQPDFFAKGYEYTSTGLPAKTQEEAAVLAKYGGEMIFTPGDIVYSSTRLINLAPPSIKHEKLLTFMDSEGLTFDSLRDALKKLGGARVHVVGDTIVDSYTYAAMIGGQTKTPTMSVLFERREDFIGGAAVVAKHLRAAGAEVVFSTVLGDDAYKSFVLEGLAADGIDCRAIIDTTRPTTNKNAIVSEGYRLLKLDTLDNRSISDEILDKLAKEVAGQRCDAVVFSDFRHGIFNRRTIPTLTGAIPAGRFKVADSQVASRWGNITEFKDFDLITPNEREARFALADQDSGIRPLASALYDAARCKTLILKLGERGVLTCRSSDHESLDSFVVVDSFVDRVVDAVGAGDALLAYATLSKLATGSDAIATILGSLAAACECEVDGNVPITSADVARKLDAIERLANYDDHGKKLRAIVVGLGVQGRKRQVVAGADCVATVDPVNAEARFKRVQDVALDAYDAALVCTPDEPKAELLAYLLGNGKHVLVEKPLWTAEHAALDRLEALARERSAVCYTAYNHRFEPHYVRMRELIGSGALGRIYHCRMFYGNGTARLVRDSAWRDQGAGVLPDLGSHLLDTAAFWFGALGDAFEVIFARNFENRSPDHVVIGKRGRSSSGVPQLELEMTLLSWRNHFTCDVFAERGSAHIRSLCKWGPSTFTQRTRVLPSGRPTEDNVVLEQADPTWELEYAHFRKLCAAPPRADLSQDRWLQKTLRALGKQALGRVT